MCKTFRRDRKGRERERKIEGKGTEKENETETDTDTKRTKQALPVDRKGVAGTVPQHKDRLIQGELR